MRRFVSEPTIKHTARFALAFFAVTVFFIFLNANTKWTGYKQAVINVLSSLGQGDLRAYLLIGVMAGLIVFVVRKK